MKESGSMGQLYVFRHDLKRANHVLLILAEDFFSPYYLDSIISDEIKFKKLIFYALILIFHDNSNSLLVME